MKITKVKWANHKVLGNLVLDFTDSSSQPFETIVFAGENGVGKTTVLETLSTFLNLGTFEHFDYIEYLIGTAKYTATKSNHQHKNFFQITDQNGAVHQVHSDKGNNFSLVQSSLHDLRKFGCVFSKARADYKTEKISSTTTKQLDSDKYDSDSEDDFTSLKQLLVDIHNQDNASYAEMNQQSTGNAISWATFNPTSKVFRFKNAFDTFFEKIKYEKVQDVGQEKKIIFKKNSKDVSIDDLSTGEKQIVFRGCFLLKNSKNLNRVSSVMRPIFHS